MKNIVSSSRLFFILGRPMVVVLRLLVFLSSLPVEEISFYNIDDLTVPESHHLLNRSDSFTYIHIFPNFDSINSLSDFNFDHEKNSCILKSVPFPHIGSLLDWKLLNVWRWRPFSTQWIYIPNVSWLLHPFNVLFILSRGFVFWVVGKWLCFETVVKLFAFINHKTLTLELWRRFYPFSWERFTLSWSSQLCWMLIYFGLERAFLYFSLHFFKSWQIFFVSYNVMK